MPRIVKKKGAASPAPAPKKRKIVKKKGAARTDRPKITQIVNPYTHEVEEQHFPEIDARMAELDRIKAEGRRYVQIEAELIALYRDYGLTTYKNRTLVEGHTTHIDYDAIMAELTPAQRKLVTKRVIDPEKLEGAIKTGKISPYLVSKHTSITPRKPYFSGIGK